MKYSPGQLLLVKNSILSILIFYTAFYILTAGHNNHLIQSIDMELKKPIMLYFIQEMYLLAWFVFFYGFIAILFNLFAYYEHVTYKGIKLIFNLNKFVFAGALILFLYSGL